MNKSEINDELRADSTMALHPTENTNRKGRTKQCCKRMFKFLFSHIGLVGMVIIYTVLGGLLFEILEQHEEKRLCEVGKGEEATTITKLKADLLTYIQFNITSNPSDTDKDNETVTNKKIETWLVDFREKVLEVQDDYGYTGSCEKPKWDLPGAILFAVTIITTIGYGNITPATWEGQIVCICYATIGIPLFLMCISNISGVLGDMFRFLYSRVCCGLCRKSKKKDGGNLSSDRRGSTAGITANVGARGITPNWVDSSSTHMNKKANNDIEDKYIDDPEDEEEEEKVSVPLTVTMIIITGYLATGAALFNNFEQWSLVQAGYFCYITLSTIGFGDFVPGQKENDSEAGLKLILGAVYILFGISIIGMCFDLMQEEIIAKFTWIGKKLGFVEQKSEDNSVEENDTASTTTKENGKNKQEAQQKIPRMKSSYTNDSFSGDATFKSNRTTPMPTIEVQERLRTSVQHQKSYSGKKVF
jgi:potassium channel subfamily K, invertebrate